MRKFFTFLSILVIGVIVLLKCSGNEHLIKAVNSTYLDGKEGPTIEDLEVFHTREVKPGNFQEIDYSLGREIYLIDNSYVRRIEKYDPIAFLIIQNEHIIFDKYWAGYSDASMTNSFSAAKSIVGLCILKAIDMGLIRSLDDKAIEYLPELDGEYAEEVTIRHLLQMTSGMNFDESYGDPLGFMAKAYYGDDLEDVTLDYEAETEPGTEWKYLGGNTIMLSIILNRVSNQNLSEFVSRHFWAPLGSPSSALWSLDSKNGMEKAYCCFYTNALDFSRFGFIVQGMGVAGGKRYISEDLIKELQKPVVLKDGTVIPHYGLQWWRIKYKETVVSYARGIFGQYIISIPDWDMTVVRMGWRRGDKDANNHPVDLYDYLDFAFDIHEQSLGLKEIEAPMEDTLNGLTPAWE